MLYRCKKKTERLNPSAPLEKNDQLERRIEKRLSDVNSFNNSTNNIKQLLTFFKDKNYKSEKKYENYKRVTTILKSIDTFVIIATTSSSITLSLTGLGLTLIPTSSSIACGLTISNKKIYETIMRKYNKYKNQ